MYFLSDRRSLISQSVKTKNFAAMCQDRLQPGGLLSVWLLIHFDIGSAGKLQVPDSASDCSQLSTKLVCLSQIISVKPPFIVICYQEGT